MGTSYLTAIQPNPRGKDVARPGVANANLNEEWVQFTAVGGDCPMTGYELLHYTFDARCNKTDEERLERFNSGVLTRGKSIRMHTGVGQPYWDGDIYHMYLNRNWYVWNNSCGDYAVLRLGTQLVDWAFYSAAPPEGMLRRVQGTNRFE